MKALSPAGRRYHACELAGRRVQSDFRPSGALHERIEKDERTDLFALADMGHSLKLLRDGLRNRRRGHARHPMRRCGPESWADDGELFRSAARLGDQAGNLDPKGRSG